MKQWHSATASRMKLRSASLIEFRGYNPEPVRSWKIARQTERRRMYPWRAAPNRVLWSLLSHRADYPEAWPVR